MEAIVRNKAAVMDVLAAHGITSVVVTFDGASDSGQVDSVVAQSGEATVQLPATTVVLVVDVEDEEPRVRADGTPLAEAIEMLCYDLLVLEYDGWETNEGAFGTFTFTVVDGSIVLDFNQRFIDSENYIRTF
jgi:hypothetical protein